MNDDLQLTKATPMDVAPVAAPAVTSLSILEAAVRGGINKENVEVVERLVALRREEVNEESKRAFAKAFFQLRRSMPELYADKSAKNNSGVVAYTYCSEEEISRMLEPHLFAHGFTMLFGQRQEDARTIAIVTLMHEGGHAETREFSVRAGNTNAMKDATAADVGSTTTAWRHLMIKMFGLKSRIRTDYDPRVEGGFITEEQADDIERRCALVHVNRELFMQFAGAKTYREIRADRYDEIIRMIVKKETRQ
jgi:hypothetical protein